MAQENNKIQEVWLGREFTDHAKDLSLLIAEFLQAFTHIIVYRSRMFPSSQFRISSFYGLLTEECTENETSEYIHKVSRSVRKWVLHQNLQQYMVVLADNLAISIAEYQLRFYQPQVPMKRKVQGYKKRIGKFENF